MTPAASQSASVLRRPVIDPEATRFGSYDGPTVLSLYRRHRPRTFDQVVGQEHIVRTLRNAIQLEKVHHAYLFVGSRGTGKTSMAKLLACALNATDRPRIDFDPADPNCLAILQGTSPSVVE